MQRNVRDSRFEMLNAKGYLPHMSALGRVIDAVRDLRGCEELFEQGYAIVSADELFGRLACLADVDRTSVTITPHTATYPNARM